MTEQNEFEPSPEEIRRRCELIQSEWSPEERRARGEDGGAVRIPTIHVPAALRGIKAD